MPKTLYDRLIGMIVESSEEGLKNDYKLLELVTNLIDQVMELKNCVVKLETRIIEIEGEQNVKH
jgi:hypothetical protein